MRHSLLLACLFGSVLSAQPKPGTASIEGHVFNSLTGAPLRKASVALRSFTIAPPIALEASTDATGKFQFTGLPAGTYRLSAKRAGFLERTAHRPISVAQDGNVTGAEIRLPPQGVIAGCVQDEDGDPVPDAWVMLFRQVYRDGRKQWERGNSNARTNDTGEYRFAGLKPGRYLLQARHERLGDNNRYGERPKAFYVPTYYPNAPGQQAALPVEVGRGADISGVDIHLARIAVPPSFDVRGRVTGLSLDSQTVIIVSAHGAEDAVYAYSSGAVARPPDYGFHLTASPGQYTLFANVYSGGPEAYGSTSITITGDIAGVGIPVSPAPKIAGRIISAENGASVKLDGIRVTLDGLTYHASSQEARSDATGRLVFLKPFRPGAYNMQVNFIPDGCFVRDVKLGGESISADDFNISSSAALEIILSNTGGRVTGSVSDADGKPVPDATLTLIPADGKSHPVKQGADDYGKFQFSGLRPGKYKLFAWEEVDDDLWQDPEFRKKYENRATEIIIGPSETQNAQLRVLAVEEMK